MSGGSWDYLYRRVADAASRLADADDPKRALLAPHVERLADALRAVEWVDSLDSAPGDEHAAIDAFLAGLGVNTDGCKVGGPPPVPGIGWGVRVVDERSVYTISSVYLDADGLDGVGVVVCGGVRADEIAALYRPGDPGDQPCWRRE